MKHILPILLTGAVLSSTTAEERKTRMRAEEWLEGQPKPNFRPGHTLPRLSRFGWVLSFKARVELAGEWGYALEFASSSGQAFADAKVVEEALTRPESEGGRLVELAAGEPDRYPLAVICSRNWTNSELPEETWAKDKDGNLLRGRNVYGEDMAAYGDVIWSPEAPAKTFEILGERMAGPLAELQARAPIAIVLNAGEYALGVLGFNLEHWEKDPRIVEAKGEESWYDYISRRKGEQETIISNAIRRVVPNRELYVFYATSSSGRRGQYPGWETWGLDFRKMRNVADLPAGAYYYKHYNTGWTGSIDLLTMATNSIGYQILLGYPLSYNWLCTGWGRGKNSAILEGDISDVERYTGFLKCLYTLGQIGGNAGYYGKPLGGFTARFASDDPPSWLAQIAALSQVHAMWSWLERFSRDGDALPGSRKHAWAKDQPAYELRSGDTAARVVGRKLKDRDEWLLTGWVTNGEDREVNVAVPGLGDVALLCRPAGSVYHGTLEAGRPVVKLLDENALSPTADPRTLENLKAVSEASRPQEPEAASQP